MHKIVASAETRKLKISLTGRTQHHITVLPGSSWIWLEIIAHVVRPL